MTSLIDAEPVSAAEYAATAPRFSHSGVRYKQVMRGTQVTYIVVN